MNTGFFLSVSDKVGILEYFVFLVLIYSTEMKKFLLIVGVILLAVIGYVVYQMATTTSHSPQDTASVSLNGSNISIVYCQPYKKDREIFGGLVPYDTYWRTGANDATEISFSSDVQFGDKTVKAGQYRFYTIPSQDEWTVVLNSELGQWGYFEPNYDLDVARVQVPVSRTQDVTEQFTISFETVGKDRANLKMKWDQTLVTVPITKL